MFMCEVFALFCDHWQEYRSKRVQNGQLHKLHSSLVIIQEKKRG